MAIFNVIIVCFMIYYTFFFRSLFLKNNRVNIQNKNNKLNTLRKVGLKTIDEQKEFINLKYPKNKKFKFTYKWLGKTLLIILISICLYKVYSWIINLLGWQFKLWQVIIIIIIFPLMINLILKKFHLEKEDITIFFR